MYCLALATLGASQIQAGIEKGINLAGLENSMSEGGSHGAVQMTGFGLARKGSEMLGILINTSTSLRDGSIATGFPTSKQLILFKTATAIPGRRTAANASDGGEGEIQGSEETSNSTTSNKDFTAMQPTNMDKEEQCPGAFDIMETLNCDDCGGEDPEDGFRWKGCFCLTLHTDAFTCDYIPYSYPIRLEEMAETAAKLKALPTWKDGDYSKDPNQEVSDEDIEDRNDNETFGEAGESETQGKPGKIEE